jgi:hypothetical protein
MCCVPERLANVKTHVGTVQFLGRCMVHSKPMVATANAGDTAVSVYALHAALCLTSDWSHACAFAGVACR